MLLAAGTLRTLVRDSTFPIEHHTSLKAPLAHH